jgi:hypothetical protein
MLFAEDPSHHYAAKTDRASLNNAWTYSSFSRITEIKMLSRKQEGVDFFLVTFYALRFMKLNLDSLCLFDFGEEER